MDQELHGVPVFGGPYDGTEDDALISDGQLCGKIYFSDLMEDYCHTYNLTYNNDDGFRLVYEGIRPFTVDDDGKYNVEE